MASIVGATAVSVALDRLGKRARTRDTGLKERSGEGEAGRLAPKELDDPGAIGAAVAALSTRNVGCLPPAIAKRTAARRGVRPEQSAHAASTLI